MLENHRWPSTWSYPAYVEHLPECLFEMASEQPQKLPALPPSRQEIRLAYADIGVHGALIPVILYLAWKHGKKGFLCWPLLASYPLMPIIASAYKLANQDKPVTPNAVSVFTWSGIVTILMLGLAGLIFEM